MIGESWPNYVMSACALIIIVGYILFGIDALRNKLLPRWNVLPLLVGLLILLSFAQPVIIESVASGNYYQLEPTISFLQFAVTGTCWVLLGYVMLNQRQGYEPAPAV
jgi:hypothetical protein